MLLTKYDLRGILGIDLTLDTIYRIVNKFINDTGAKEILVASDFNKKNLKIKEFLKNNFNVDDLGILPTPIFYYQVIIRKLPGVILTASHLPLKYVGLKFILKDGTSWGIPTLKKEKVNIDENLNKITLPSGLGPKEKEIYENYFQKLKAVVKPKEKIFVEFDLKNFFLKASLPYFKKLNIFHKKNALIKIKSDFDNDRLYIFYKNKQILADLIFYLIALQKKYKNLGVTISFCQKFKEDLINKGKKVYFIPTGHLNFKMAFKKKKLDLAFEPSGHFYMFKDLKTEGPYLAMALFLHQAKNIVGLKKLSPKIERFDLAFTNNQSTSFFLKKFTSILKNKFKLNLKKFDGYLLSKENFYLHLRKSNTENKIRISFEGDKKKLKEIKNLISNLIDTNKLNL